MFNLFLYVSTFRLFVPIDISVVPMYLLEFCFKNYFDISMFKITDKFVKWSQKSCKFSVFILEFANVFSETFFSPLIGYARTTFETKYVHEVWPRQSLNFIPFYHIIFFNISLLFFSWFRVLQLRRIRVAVEVWRNITEVSVKGKNKFSIFSKSKSDFCRSFSNTIENK